MLDPDYQLVNVGTKPDSTERYRNAFAKQLEALHKQVDETKERMAKAALRAGAAPGSLVFRVSMDMQDARLVARIELVPVEPPSA